jgi:hypothetical protein
MLLAALAVAGCVAAGEAGGAYSGTLVLAGRHVYSSGETLNGALVVVEGDVTLGAGARVSGPAYLLSGALTLQGEIAGDVSAIGGALTLGPGAVIGGDVRVGSGRLIRSPRAEVRGQVLTGAASGISPADLSPARSQTAQLIWLVPQALFLAGVAFLLVRVRPMPVRRVGRAATRHPVVAAALGLLAGIVGLVLLVVMAFTLVLIPVTVIGLVVALVAIGYGWIGMGAALGRRLAAWREWHLNPAQAAALGTFVLALLVNMLALAPVIGDWIGLAAAVVGLGAVLLTRFGLREFVPAIEGEYL